MVFACESDFGDVQINMLLNVLIGVTNLTGKK